MSMIVLSQFERFVSTGDADYAKQLVLQHSLSFYMVHSMWLI
jgi:hypothetical protein